MRVGVLELVHEGDRPFLEQARGEARTVFAAQGFVHARDLRVEAELAALAQALFALRDQALAIAHQRGGLPRAHRHARAP